jgi:hypothetical protein
MTLEKLADNSKHERNFQRLERRLHQEEARRGWGLQLQGAWATAAATPTSGTAVEVAGAGDYVVSAWASAFATVAGAHTIQVYVDGVLKGNINFYFNATGVHHAMPACVFTVSLDAGTHYVYLRQTVGTSDAQDYGGVIAVPA